MCHHEYTSFAFCPCRVVHSRQCTKCDDPLMIIYCPDYRVLETQGQGACEKHDVETQGFSIQRRSEEQASEQTQNLSHLVYRSRLHAPVIQTDLSPSPSGAESTNLERATVDQTIVQGVEQGTRTRKHRDEAVIVKYNPKTRDFERPVKPRRNPNGGLGV